MDTRPSFKRVSPFLGAVTFLFNRRKYIDLAVHHGMAINLEAPDLLRCYQVGTFPKAGWESEAAEAARANAKRIDRAIWSSFGVTLACAIAAALAAAYFGKLSPELPFSWSKALSLVGGFLAAWATLMELGGLVQTFSGNALHELIHPMLFRMLFVSGTLVVLVGQLW